MKLLVRNLSRETTEDTIRELFAEFGEVSECTLVLDAETGKSKGFAFVEMPDGKAGTKARKQLNQTKVDGVSIRVKDSTVQNTDAES